MDKESGHRNLHACPVEHCTRKCHQACSSTRLCTIHGPTSGSPEDEIPLTDEALKEELFFVCPSGGLTLVSGPKDGGGVQFCTGPKCTGKKEVHDWDEMGRGVRCRGEVERRASVEEEPFAKC